jgi:hypothetical protein
MSEPSAIPGKVRGPGKTADSRMMRTVREGIDGRRRRRFPPPIFCLYSPVFIIFSPPRARAEDSGPVRGPRRDFPRTPPKGVAFSPPERAIMVFGEGNRERSHVQNDDRPERGEIQRRGKGRRGIGGRNRSGGRPAVSRGQSPGGKGEGAYPGGGSGGGGGSESARRENRFVPRVPRRVDSGESLSGSEDQKFFAKARDVFKNSRETGKKPKRTLADGSETREFAVSGSGTR